MEFKHCFIFVLVLISAVLLRGGAESQRTVSTNCAGEERRRLRFDGRRGEFKILQIADMHYANGRNTSCSDVFPSQVSTCSDLNTTDFIYRVIRAENPDLVVFTGDNIYGYDVSDAPKSMDAAFAPAIALKLPWAAVLGIHDQEGPLSREEVMQYIIGMPHTLSRMNPEGFKIDGFGNYNLEVAGVDGTCLANKSVLNLYLLDSGDYVYLPPRPTPTDRQIQSYGWIELSQQQWFNQTSSRLQKEYMSEPMAQNGSAPGLAYFHIPLPEYNNITLDNIEGVKRQEVRSAAVNSGFFTTLLEAGDVKAVFTGADHVNDFCGKLYGIQLCYGGGSGYNGYGKVGWPRRARVVSAYLEKTVNGYWSGVNYIETWKRLDDEHLSRIDSQILWNKTATDQ